MKLHEICKQELIMADLKVREYRVFEVYHRLRRNDKTYLTLHVIIFAEMKI